MTISESLSLSLPQALRRLLWLQWRSWIRLTLRSLRTTRGLIYSGLMLGLFALFLLPALSMAFLTPRVPPETARAFFAPALLAFFVMTLLSSGPESGIHFLPAEVDLLFPAPFKRRELLLYRIISLTAGVVLVGAFLSAMLVICCTFWIAAYVGLVLGLTFLNLFQIFLGLLVSTLTESAYTRGRQIGLALLVVLIGWGVWQTLPNLTGTDLPTSVNAWRVTVAGRVLLAPFEVIANTATASQLFPDFLGWAAVATLMNLGLLQLIMRLDAHFLEKSVSATQRMQERVQLARRGQGLPALTKARGRQRPPRFPRLGGAGPIAWRQLTMALRKGHSSLLVLLVACGGTSLPLLLIGKLNGPAIAAPSVSMLVFLLPQLLQYDFRSDLDRLEVLKSLPLSPWGIVAGQLFTPVLLATVLVLTLIVGLVATGMLPAAWALQAAIMVVPANLYLFSIENLMFLVFPYQIQGNAAGDMQAIGRNMLSAFCKMFAMLAGLAIAAGVGGLAWWLTGRPEFAFVIGTVGGLLGLSAILIPLMVLAYERLDPASLHAQ